MGTQSTVKQEDLASSIVSFLRHHLQKSGSYTDVMVIIREEIRERRFREKLITRMDRTRKYDEHLDTAFESMTVQNQMDHIKTVNSLHDG